MCIFTNHQSNSSGLFSLLATAEYNFRLFGKVTNDQEKSKKIMKRVYII